VLRDQTTKLFFMLQPNLINMTPNALVIAGRIKTLLICCSQGARMVRELFEMARTKRACIIFFDEIDAVGGARFDDGSGGDNEVQRTMLELINQLDGFDPRGNVKVLMATNRPDTLDPALMRPGRLDRKVEFGVPDQQVLSAALPRLITHSTSFRFIFNEVNLFQFTAGWVRMDR